MTLSEEALAALPLFPLPSTVLFPGALLPLHVFEPRYRELTADVIAGHQLMAIPRLCPGYEAEYYGRPAVFPVAGVGAIVHSEKLEDGRYNILLRGLARVRIGAELAGDRGYRVARSSLLPTVPAADVHALLTAHEQLVSLCDKLSPHLGGGPQALSELVRAVTDPAEACDLVASALVQDADQRQRLLEAIDPAERVSLLTEEVATLLARVASRRDELN